MPDRLREDCSLGRESIEQKAGASISEPLPQRLVELLSDLSESEAAKPGRRRHAAANRSRLVES
jgi:hypothetical protein